MSDKPLEEVMKSFTDLNSAFDAFKQKNDQRIAEIEKKGTADPIVTTELDKINEALDLHQKQMDDLASQKQRGDTVEIEGKTVSIEELDKKADAWAARNAREHDRRMPETFGYDGQKAYAEAYGQFLRKNSELLTADQHKALSVGSNPDGGFLVTPDMSGRMVQRVFETSPMRQVAATATTSKDALEGIYDTDEASAGWVGERESRTETGTPQIERWAIPIHEIYAMPKATQKVLDDADTDLESWLAGKVSEKFSRIENAAFVNGDGVSKPRGFLTYPNVSTAGAYEIGKIEQFKTGAAGDFATAPAGGDALINLISNTKQAYRTGAIFAMNRLTVGGVRKLKDSDGAYLWRPGIAAGQPSQILGFNVTEMEDMPTYTTDDSLAIAFGNFSQAYQIVDRHGVRILRDPYTAKPNVLFYTIKRVGGAVIDFDAIKLLQFAD